MRLGEINVDGPRGLRGGESGERIAHASGDAHRVHDVLAEPGLARFAAEQDEPVDPAIGEQPLVVPGTHRELIGDGLEELGHVHVGDVRRGGAGQHRVPELARYDAHATLVLFGARGPASGGRGRGALAGRAFRGRALCEGALEDGVLLAGLGGIRDVLESAHLLRREAEAMTTRGDLIAVERRRDVLVELATADRDVASEDDLLAVGDRDLRSRPAEVDVHRGHELVTVAAVQVVERTHHGHRLGVHADDVELHPLEEPDVPHDRVAGDGQADRLGTGLSVTVHVADLDRANDDRVGGAPHLHLELRLDDAVALGTLRHGDLHVLDERLVAGYATDDPLALELAGRQGLGQFPSVEGEELVLVTSDVVGNGDLDRGDHFGRVAHRDLQQLQRGRPEVDRDGRGLRRKHAKGHQTASRGKGRSRASGHRPHVSGN